MSVTIILRVLKLFWSLTNENGKKSWTQCINDCLNIQLLLSKVNAFCTFKRLPRRTKAPFIKSGSLKYSSQ
jgi:hypothetical protein